MKESSSNKTLFLTGMILSMTCWGLSWTSSKVIAAYGSPLTLSLIRFTLTFLSMIVILAVLRQPFTINKKGIKDLIGASITISLYTVVFFKGITTGKAGAGGVLVTVLNPIISYGIMLIMERRRPTRNETIGLSLGLLAGIVLLKLPMEASTIFSAGNIYFLVASFCWAVLSVFTSKASRYGSTITFSTWMYGICIVLLFILTGVKGPVATLSTADGIFWFNLFVTAVLATALATTFYFIATSRLGASQASSYIFLVPFSAALGAWIFLKEVPQWHTIAGGLLGIAAVYILNSKRRY
ncbi:MAG TPA: DMT family transporter [Chryseolinea sp.]|nr:DMT family transporter [Chryseolinea sp.]